MVNVVVIISDQQRADTLCPELGDATDRLSPTMPHVSKLATEATVFRRAYCTTPICTPARASLLSGQYPHATGMVANHQARPGANEMRLPADVQVLADYLRPHGYACAYTGKWHLGTGADRRGFGELVTRRFDHDVDVPEQSDSIRFAEKIGIVLSGKQSGVEPDPSRYDPRTEVGTSLLPLAFHPSHQDAEASAAFVRRMADEDQRFLLVFSCHEPHPPFVSPTPFSELYLSARGRLELPTTRREEGGGPALRTMRGDLHTWLARDFSDEDLQSMWAAYCGAVSYVDHLIGVILTALIETDLLDDTLLVVTSDHGEMLGGHGLILKGAVLYEEVVRVPLLIRPPWRRLGRAPVQTETQHLVGHVDLLPTILRFCGVPAPENAHGVDIGHLALGDEQPVRDGLALQFHSVRWREPPWPLRGWLTSEWKYVESPTAAEELYCLASDPDESQNLVASPEAETTREMLRDQLHGWMSHVGDDWQVGRSEQPACRRA